MRHGSGDIESVLDTALWVAHFRAKESERPDALFRDPLAARLSGERGRRIAEGMPYGRIMAWVMAIRTQAIDRLVLKAVARGVDVVLNLGAGLDARPYRLNLPQELRWIEADFPAMIDYKSEVLASEKPVCLLERTAVDLSDHQARRRFLKSLRGKKILVLTEGVIPYLTNEQASDLAEDLRGEPSFHYWIQDYRHGGYENTIPGGWKKKLKAAPFQFQTPDWFAYFARHGWSPVETVVMVPESFRLKRLPPFIFPWSLTYFLMTPKKRAELRDAAGYVMMGRK